MKMVYPIPDHIRPAVQNPKHAELMRAIAKPMAWVREEGGQHAR